MIRDLEAPVIIKFDDKRIKEIDEELKNKYE